MELTAPRSFPFLAPRDELFTKGISSDAHGQTIVACIIHMPDGSTIKATRRLAEHTNSFAAELEATLRAMQCARAQGATCASIRSNSQTAVALLNHHQKSQKGYICELVYQCWEQEDLFDGQVEYAFVPLSDCTPSGNFAQAHQLARDALG
jgi:ribonuclease HI